MFYQRLSLFLTWVILVATAQATALIPDRQGLEIEAAFAIAAVKRAYPDAPNNYVPAAASCPSTRPAVRSANTLSPEEQSWLEKRRNNTIDPMKDLLGRLNVTDFDIDSWFNAHGRNASALPNIGMAFSGGGYRALMNGAGALAAFDIRTSNSTASGHLGGLLQASTYVAGLSGGSWLVGSIYTNNFTTVTDIIDSNTGNLWQFDNSIFEGPTKSGIQVLNTAEYYSSIYNEVSNKEDAGWHVSITDFWGRALSFQLINATDGGPAYTFSSIQDDPQFSSGDVPMPILVADGRAPNETIVSGNTTVYEFNPYEFGTFDPTVFGFVPTRFLGSNFTAGEIPSNDRCIRGFDNAGFIMGVSSTLFNQFLLQINGTSIPAAFKTALTAVLEDVGEDNDDIADIYPNPFYHYNNDSNPGANATTLTLVDGGEDLQNIPLHPLIQPERNLDVIFAIDSSADTNFFWPNGTSLVATYQRSLNNSGIGNGTAFPYVPDQNTFVNLGLNTRPTFFGCNTSNMTGPGPLIVYLANYPYVFNSNVSTFQPTTNNSERNAIIQNGYDVVTMGNATTDSQWPTCVGCAILSRSLERTNTTLPSVCEQCFSKFCWDGTVNSTQPANYAPPTTFTSIKVNGAAGLKRVGPLALLAALVTGAALM